MDHPLHRTRQRSSSPKGDTRILIDPFLAGHSPVAPGRPPTTSIPPTSFLTHGHVGPTPPTRWAVAKRNGRPSCVAIVELAGWFERETGVENTADPNLGGTVRSSTAGWVRLVPAWHTSTTPDGKVVNTPARARHQPRRQDDLPPR